MMEKVNPDFSIPSFIILVGISGSGKSTWIKSHNIPNAVVISFDDIRREVNGNVNDHTDSLKIIYIGLNRIIDALNAGKNVILDATNVRTKDRREQLNYIKEHVNRPFNAYAKIFYGDPEVTKERIRKDIENGVDRSDVPPEAVDRQYNKFIMNLDKIESDGYKIIA
jgi:predicted kinase